MDLTENKALTTGLKNYLTHQFAKMTQRVVNGWRVYVWDRQTERVPQAPERQMRDWCFRYTRTRECKQEFRQIAEGELGGYGRSDTLDALLALGNQRQTPGQDPRNDRDAAHAVYARASKPQRIRPSAAALVKRLREIDDDAWRVTPDYANRRADEISLPWMKKLCDGVSDIAPNVYKLIHALARDGINHAALIARKDPKQAAQEVGEAVAKAAQRVSTVTDPNNQEFVQRRLQWAAQGYVNRCVAHVTSEYSRANNWPKYSADPWAANPAAEALVANRIKDFQAFAQEFAFDAKEFGPARAFAQAFRYVVHDAITETVRLLTANSPTGYDRSDEYYTYERMALQTADHATKALAGLGIRRSLRCPIVFFYQKDPEPSGFGTSFAAGKFYTHKGRNAAVMYGDKVTLQTLNTTLHEIGHKVFDMLTPDQQARVKQLAETTPPLTHYSRPDFVYPGTDAPHANHTSGNEWLAEMFMLLATNPSLNLNVRPANNPLMDKMVGPNTLNNVQLRYWDTQKVNAIAKAFTELKRILGGF